MRALTIPPVKSPTIRLARQPLVLPPQIDPSCVLCLLPIRGNKWVDYSGKGNHGTVTSATGTSKGRRGFSWYFSGGVERIDCGNDTSLYSATGSWELWYKYGGTYADTGGLMKIGDLGWNNQFMIGTRGAAHNLWAVFREGNPVYPFTWHLAFPNDSAIQDYWRHIVIVQDGVAAKGYLDGEYVLTATLGADLTAWTDRFQAGAEHLYFSDKADVDYPNFYVDEARIYTRPLEAAEIKALYQQGRGR